MWTVVDLGTKSGGAIDSFRQRYGQHFQNGLDITPKTCLGVDRDEKRRAEIEEKGYSFMHADILSRDFSWPEADFYTVANLLEYLPTVQHAVMVVRAMLDHAKRGVWVRVSSHESNESALGQLRRHGLKFYWTDWRSHRAQVQLVHLRALGMNRSSISMTEIPRALVRDSSDVRVVPVTASHDCSKYTLDMNEKPLVTFDPPLVAEWDVFFHLGKAE